MSRLSPSGRDSRADFCSPTGIFIKYDIEPMSLTIRERTTTLLQFLVRLAGIVGGILGAFLSPLAGSTTAHHRPHHFQQSAPTMDSARLTSWSTRSWAPQARRQFLPR